MAERSVIAVGNFDGVHLGHQALFAEAGRLAEAHEASVVAVTFDVHPLAVLRPGTEPPTILHRDQRAAALRAAGADRVDWLEADASLLKLEPREFLAMMVERYRPLAMVEGTNFRFGKGRQGGPENLPHMAEAMGFEARIAPLSTVTLRDKTVVDVSSSLVRWLVGRGRLADVALCLGRPLVLRGTVVEGEKRGRTIGYPTLNLDCGRQMLPCDGVYGASISIDGRAHAAAVSIGRKPTFGSMKLTCEAHVLDYSGDLYGETVDLAMHRWVRDQRKYPSVADLQRQLQADTQTVRRLWNADMLGAAELATC
jgi:riboflavin kinase/FMN adenylyltransferase